MTIAEYINTVKKLDGRALAIAAIDANEFVIKRETIDAWDKGESPSFIPLYNAHWEGNEPSEGYRRFWKINQFFTYHYRKINISGNTRKELKVEGGRVFSAIDYWAGILRNFSSNGFSPVDFSRYPKTSPAKVHTAAAFFEFMRAAMAR